MPFTAVITLAPEGCGTHCTAMVMHKSSDAARRHAEMGFYEGWGACLNQLVEYVRCNCKQKRTTVSR